MKHLFSVGLLCLFTIALMGQTQIYQLDFESPGGYSTSITEFTDGSGDYFRRTDGSNISSTVEFTNKQGSWYFGTQDIDGEGASLPVFLNIDNIDISGYTNLELRVHLAEDDDGSNQDWDDDDYVHFGTDLDNTGSFSDVLNIESELSSGTNGLPLVDTDFDGVGDGSEITEEFQQFTSSISGTGSQLDIEIEFDLDSGDEDIAIDNIEIWGIATNTASVGFVNTSSSISEGNTGTTTHTVDVELTNYQGSPVTVEITDAGTGTATGSGTDYSFSTQSLTFSSATTKTVDVTIQGDGVSEDDETIDLDLAVTSGSANTGNDAHEVTISDDDVPKIIITEVMQNPAEVSDNDGEYFEVYNYSSSSIDLNGWSIEDAGSDNHTISSSVVVASEGFAVLGVNSNSSTNGGVSVDYQYSSISLANGDDEIILKDASGIEVDRVEYDGGPNWPDPDGAAMIFQGGTNENNNDGSLWGEATVAEGINNDFGSPGSNGTGQILDYLIFTNSAWNTTPDNTTGTQNAIVRSGESTSFTSNVSLNNLEVESTASLTVSSNTFTLNGNLTNNGTVTIADGASLLTTDANANLDVIEVQRTGTQYNNIYNYWSSPVQGATWDNVWGSGYTSGDFYEFNATNQQFVNYSTGTAMAKGKGYAMTGKTAGGANTVTFSGTPHNGNATVSLEYNDNGNDQDDYNLIGNPYPSAVDAGQFTSNNSDIEGTLWYWDRNLTGSHSSDDYSTWTSTGGTAGNAGGAIPNDFIPSTQGFMVKANTTTPDVTFTNGYRVAGNNGQFFKAAPIERLWLTAVNDNDDWNQLLIGFTLPATDGYDNRYDGPKLKGNPNIAFYSKLNGEDYAIQGLAPIGNGKSVPLGLDANVTGTYTISIDSIDGIPNDVDILLENTSTGNFYDLRENDYTLSVSEARTIDNLVLHFRTQSTGIDLEQGEPLVNIWQSGSNLIVKDLDNAPLKSIRVVDLNGRTVRHLTSPASSLTQFGVSDWPAGIYLVEVTSNQHVQTEKIFIK